MRPLSQLAVNWCFIRRAIIEDKLGECTIARRCVKRACLLWAYSVEKLTVFAALHHRMNGFRLDFTGLFWPDQSLELIWLTF